MKSFILFFIFLITHQLCAQKQIDETFSASGIKEIVIEGNHIFKINLQTKPLSTFHFISKIEGEYTPEIAVIHEIVDSTLYVKSAFKPSFALHNDKLSAHKVVSIELR